MRRSDEAAKNDAVILTVVTIVAVVTAVVGALMYGAWCLGETLAAWCDQ